MHLGLQVENSAGIRRASPVQARESLRFWLMLALSGIAAAVAATNLDVARVFIKYRDCIIPTRNLFAALLALNGLLALAGLAAAIVFGGPILLLIRRMWPRAAHRLLRLSVLASILAAVAATALLTVVVATGETGMVRGPGPDRLVRAGAPDRPPNVVLIVADSLREDVLERPDRNTIANHILKLADEGVSYTSCQSVCCWTRPSVAGLLTGRYPSTLGVHTNTLPQEADTLAEHLQACGYETACVSDNYLVGVPAGFDQGHDWFWQRNNCMVLGQSWLVQFVLPQLTFRWLTREFHLLYEGGERVNATVAKWIDNRDTRKPFYLMLHYMEAHYPWYLHPDLPNNYSNRSKPEHQIRYYRMIADLADQPKPPFSDYRLPAEFVEDFRTRYLGGVQILDRHVAELLRLIRDTGEWDNTLVIFTADHGEEFFEHHFFSHGRALYQESIRVPLIIKYPRTVSVAATHIDQPVSSLRVMPTILQLAGALQANPSEHFLPPLPCSPDDKAVPAFSEFFRDGITIVSGRAGRYKRLYSHTQDGRELNELYDKQQDRAEKCNLWGPRTRPPSELDRPFLEFARAIVGANEGNRTEMSVEVRNRLRSLGYLD